MDARSALKWLEELATAYEKQAADWKGRGNRSIAAKDEDAALTLRYAVRDLAKEVAADEGADAEIHAAIARNEPPF